MFLKKRKVIFLTSIFLFVLIIIIDSLKAQKIKVIDGDTIHLNGEKIRFSGIDSPEISQKCIRNGAEESCGIKAKQALIDKIGKNTVVCIRQKKDQYKRTLAECFIDNESLSSYLVKNGYAFDWSRYSKGKFLEDQEYAKNNNLGIWGTKFKYPWAWRLENK